MNPVGASIDEVESVFGISDKKTDTYIYTQLETQQTASGFCLIRVSYMHFRLLYDL